jgi:L-malate glycosyltransferase
VRICFFAKPDLIHSQRWIRYFIKCGHDVHIITHIPYEMEGAKVHTFSRSGPLPNISLLFRLHEVKHLLKSINPDIVHAHYVINNGRWAWMVGAHPLVLTAWGSDILVESKSFINRRLTSRILKTADLITCDSEYLRGKIHEFGVSEKKTVNIQWGVDFNALKVTDSLEHIRNKYNIPQNHQIVMSPRDIKALYNVDRIIRAIPHVLRDIPATTFIIKFLSQQYSEELVNLSRDLGVEANCRFVGPLERQELANLYTISDICVSIPSSDSTPISILEAMYCGSFPIVCDLPPNREWIVDKQNGFIVKSSNANDLASSIIQALINKDFLSSVKKYNQDLVMENANFDKNMMHMEALYRSLI